MNIAVQSQRRRHDARTAQNAKSATGSRRRRPHHPPRRRRGGGSDNAGNAAVRSTVTITPDPSCQGEDFEGGSLVWFANSTEDYPDEIRQEPAAAGGRGAGATRQP
ncbi:hypothetical protein [Streptomyces sp. UG1]|uniref:hypothetical protein n=1 Tax=Streptomyces sp. UG1 TaxID=3417652 RepID=UPI003CECB1BA